MMTHFLNKAILLFFFNNSLRRTHLNIQIFYRIIMKAKKIVRVELKNPALRRIRKGFRDIIELAVKQEVSRLYAIFREYKEKRLKAKDPIEKEVLDRKGARFMDRGRMLMGLLSKSIIKCKSGGVAHLI